MGEREREMDVGKLEREGVKWMLKAVKERRKEKERKRGSW